MEPETRMLFNIADWYDIPATVVGGRGEVARDQERGEFGRSAIGKNPDPHRGNWLP